MPSKARQTKIQKNKTEPKNAQFWGLKAWSHALGPLDPHSLVCQIGLITPILHKRHT